MVKMNEDSKVTKVTKVNLVMKDLLVYRAHKDQLAKWAILDPKENR